MTSQTLSGTDWWQLSPLQSGLVVSLSLAGALAGSGAPRWGWLQGARTGAPIALPTDGRLPSPRRHTPSLPPFYLLPSHPAAGALLYGDQLGRRRELLAASGLYGLGSLIVALSPGLPAVMAGRALYGVGIGLAMHAAPAYIAGAFSCFVWCGMHAAAARKAPPMTLIRCHRRRRSSAPAVPTALFPPLPETSPARVRGLLISLKEAFIVGGILAG